MAWTCITARTPSNNSCFGWHTQTHVLLTAQGVRRVVGIVGSAHVRGMVREWRALKAGEEGVADVARLLEC